MTVASMRWGTAWRAIVRRRGISTRAGMPFYRPQARPPEEFVVAQFDDLNDRTCPSVPPPPHNGGSSHAQGGADHCPAMRRHPPLRAPSLGPGVEVPVGAVIAHHRLPEVGRPVR